jgi:hypothetical protein
MRNMTRPENGWAGAWPSFLARPQVVVDRLAKRRLQLVDRSAVEAHDIADPGHVANEDSIVRVELDACGTAAIGHHAHGLTAIRSRNARASFTR